MVLCPTPAPPFQLRRFCRGDDLIKLALQFVVRFELAWVNDRCQRPALIQDRLHHVGIANATVVRWVRDGIIPAKRFGKRIIKIPCGEVARLVNQK